MQATPLVAGLAVGAAAYAGKLAIEMAMKMRAAPRLRNFYKVRRASRGFVCVVSQVAQLYAALQHCAFSLCGTTQPVLEGGSNALDYLRLECQGLFCQRTMLSRSLCGDTRACWPAGRLFATNDKAGGLYDPGSAGERGRGPR